MKTDILFCYHSGKTRTRDELEGVEGYSHEKGRMGGRGEVENEVRHRDCRSTDGTSVLTVYVYIQHERIANSSRVLLLTLARRRKREIDDRIRKRTRSQYNTYIKQLRGRTGVCAWTSGGWEERLPCGVAAKRRGCHLRGRQYI